MNGEKKTFLFQETLCFQVLHDTKRSRLNGPREAIRESYLAAERAKQEALLAAEREKEEEAARIAAESKKIKTPKGKKK